MFARGFSCSFEVAQVTRVDGPGACAHPLSPQVRHSGVRKSWAENGGDWLVLEVGPTLQKGSPDRSVCLEQAGVKLVLFLLL